jgi:hypothetical protein
MSTASTEVDIDARWTIGGKPNGGYLLSLLGAAAGAAGPHPHVIAASAHYLHSPEPGAGGVETELLRAGRSASQLRARLVQSGRTCVEALLTTATLPADSEPTWSGGVPDPGTTRRDDAVRLPGTTPTGIPVALMEVVDIRLDRDSLGFGVGRPSGRGELRGWVELPDGATFDPAWLLFAVDALPPATFDIRLSGWVPTLELSAYVRALPAPGPVRVIHRAQLVQDDRVDETCWVWDSRGRLVAQSTQLAGVRFR